MELFGIILSIPAAFVASLVYCVAVAVSVVKFPRLASAMWGASFTVLLMVAAEFILVIVRGAIGTRELVGPSYYPLHVVGFFLGPPSLGNVMLLWRRAPPQGGWWTLVAAAVLACTALAFALVLLQYGVTEALYGIDGSGGPYSRHVTALPASGG
jgi:hypothetical protein